MVLGVSITLLIAVIVVLFIIRSKQKEAARYAIRRDSPSRKEWKIGSWTVGGLLYFGFAIAGLLTGRLMLAIVGLLVGLWRLYRSGYVTPRLEKMKQAGELYDTVVGINTALVAESYSPRSTIESLTRLSKMAVGSARTIALFASTYPDSQEEAWRESLSRALYSAATFMRTRGRVGRILYQKLGNITFIRSTGLVLLLALCLALNRFLTLQGEALVISVLVIAAAFDTLADEVSHL